MLVQKGKKGLLTYEQESFTNNGLSPRGVYQLSHFLATQNVKHKMLGLIANTLQNVDSGSFRPFKYKNLPLNVVVKVNNKMSLMMFILKLEQFLKVSNYRSWSKIFNDLASNLLNGEELTFGASVRNAEKSEDTGFTPSKKSKSRKWNC